MKNLHSSMVRLEINKIVVLEGVDKVFTFQYG